MEKTKEQKLASKQRYIAQVAKAIEMLQSNKLYDFLDGLKYTYSLIRYKKNHREFIEDATYFNKVQAKKHLDKCLKAGILKPWSDTYWFDKDKAERLQQYILEHQN